MLCAQFLIKKFLLFFITLLLVSPLKAMEENETSGHQFIGQLTQDQHAILAMLQSEIQQDCKDNPLLLLKNYLELLDKLDLDYAKNIADLIQDLYNEHFKNNPDEEAARTIICRQIFNDTRKTLLLTPFIEEQEKQINKEKEQEREKGKGKEKEQLPLSATLAENPLANFSSDVPLLQNRKFFETVEALYNAEASSDHPLLTIMKRIDIIQNKSKEQLFLECNQLMDAVENYASFAYVSSCLQIALIKRYNFLADQDYDQTLWNKINALHTMLMVKHGKLQPLTSYCMASFNNSSNNSYKKIFGNCNLEKAVVTNYSGQCKRLDREEERYEDQELEEAIRQSMAPYQENPVGQSLIPLSAPKKTSLNLKIEEMIAYIMPLLREIEENPSPESFDTIEHITAQIIFDHPLELQQLEYFKQICKEAAQNKLPHITTAFYQKVVNLSKKFSEGITKKQCIKNLHNLNTHIKEHLPDFLVANNADFTFRIAEAIGKELQSEAINNSQATVIPINEPYTNVAFIDQKICLGLGHFAKLYNRKGSLIKISDSEDSKKLDGKVVGFISNKKPYPTDNPFLKKQTLTSTIAALIAPLAHEKMPYPSHYVCGNELDIALYNNKNLSWARIIFLAQQKNSSMPSYAIIPTNDYIAGAVALPHNNVLLMKKPRKKACEESTRKAEVPTTVELWDVNNPPAIRTGSFHSSDIDAVAAAGEKIAFLHNNTVHYFEKGDKKMEQSKVLYTSPTDRLLTQLIGSRAWFFIADTKGNVTALNANHTNKQTVIIDSAFNVNQLLCDAQAENLVITYNGGRSCVVAPLGPLGD